MKHSISISREEMKKKYILKLLLSFVIIFSELTGTWNVKIFIERQNGIINLRAKLYH